MTTEEAKTIIGKTSLEPYLQSGTYGHIVEYIIAFAERDIALAIIGAHAVGMAEGKRMERSKRRTERNHFIIGALNNLCTKDVERVYWFVQRLIVRAEG